MPGSLLSIEDFKARLNAIAEARLTDHRFGVSALAREMEMSCSTLHRKVNKNLQQPLSKWTRVTNSTSWGFTC